MIVIMLYLHKIFMRVGLTFNVRKKLPLNLWMHNQMAGQKILTTILLELSAPPSDRYAEWDDAETTEAVKSNRKQDTGYLIEADESAFDKLKSERPDIVFNMAEGYRRGPKVTSSPCLKCFGIPYTASDPSLRHLP
jgi:hypothetical protein